MFKSIKNKLISLLQLILVIIYIIFEELIWEGIAKPIYVAIHGLKVLQKIEVKLAHANPSFILVLFVGLLVIVEAFGIYAGMLFVSGQVLLGLALYISKIPIAAFTFWLFRATEDKLMQFTWFKWVYDRIMNGIEWVQNCEMYIKTMQYLKHTKIRMKAFSTGVKEKYFATQSPFTKKVKDLYSAIKRSLKR